MLRIILYPNLLIILPIVSSALASGNVLRKSACAKKENKVDWFCAEVF